VNSRMTVSSRIVAVCILATAPCPGLIGQSFNSLNREQKDAGSCDDTVVLRKRLELVESRLRDWAGLAYFAQANRAVQPSTVGEERVVFMGDSITGLWHLPIYFPQTYLNRAIAGQETGQMLLRFRKDVIALKPKAVVILGGINDLRGSDETGAVQYVEENLSSMAEIANANGIRVVLASILPVADPPSTNETQAAQIRKVTTSLLDKINLVNSWMQRYSAENGFTYLDFHSSMLGSDGKIKTDLTVDGLHPSEKGYRLMAPLAQAAIKSALGNPTH
jgi:lysophospholipase L1-like esterase